MVCAAGDGCGAAPTGTGRATAFTVVALIVARRFTGIAVGDVAELRGVFGPVGSAHDTDGTSSSGRVQRFAYDAGRTPPSR